MHDGINQVSAGSVINGGISLITLGSTRSPDRGQRKAFLIGVRDPVLPVITVSHVSYLSITYLRAS